MYKEEMRVLSCTSVGSACHSSTHIYHTPAVLDLFFVHMYNLGHQ